MIKTGISPINRWENDYHLVEVNDLIDYFLYLGKNHQFIDQDLEILTKARKGRENGNA